MTTLQQIAKLQHQYPLLSEEEVEDLYLLEKRLELIDQLLETFDPNKHDVFIDVMEAKRKVTVSEIEILKNKK